jgi:hypothetical protein
MINVNDFRVSVFAQANKDGIGFKPNGAEFNAFLADALRETYNELFGTTEDYQAGRPVPNVSSEKTRYVSEAERYLKENRILNITNSRVPIPNGTTVTDQNAAVCPEFRHLLAIYNLYIPINSTIYQRKEVTVLKSAEVGWRLNHEINYPTLKEPIAELNKDYYQLYPANITNVELVYQRVPLVPNWGFTVDLTLEARRRREIYDPATSVNIDLPDQMFNVMKERVLFMMGVRERDPYLTQAAAQRIQSNQ